MRAKLKPLWPFLRYIAEQWRLVVVAMVTALVVTALNLVVPWLFKMLTDQVLVPREDVAVATRLERLASIIGIMIGVFVVRRILQAISSYFATKVVLRMTVNVRSRLAEHLHALPLGFFDEQRSGALVSNVGHDVSRVEMLLYDVMVSMFTAPLTVAGAVVLVFWLDVYLGAVALLVLPPLYLLIQATGRRLRSIATEVQAVMETATNLFLESVRHVRIVRVFNRQSYEVGRFSERASEAAGLALRNVFTASAAQCGAELILLIGFALVLWVGGGRIATGALSMGSLIALVAYLQTMRSSLQILTQAYNNYQTALGAGGRILNILNEDPLPERVYPPLPDHHAFEGRVVLENLSFRYPDGTEVLRDANAELQPGENVALIGESGAGKSTLANVLLGLFSPQQGRIVVDGVPLADIPPAERVRVVSIVPQDIGLFSGTVRDNIAYGRPEATAEEVEQAARAANAHDFIMRLPKGYDTSVGDQGMKLSGGQRQRIAIARALLRNPRFLILDEATSHVDRETENLVQEALQRLMADRTTLIIAHKPSALRGVDRILLLKNGQLHPVDDPLQHVPELAAAEAFNGK